MGFLTHEQKTKILRLKSNGKGPSEIVRILAEDDVKISCWSVIRFLRKFQERKSLDNAAKSGCPPLGVTMELLNFIDAEMESNDELTSPELARRILLRFRVQFSSQKVRRLRRKLGWVPTGTKYCQLICESDRVKRLRFSEKCLWENEQFNDVIFTDESSVLLENNSKISFHRRWEQPKLKGKLKHPVKVHFWAGISKRGPTQLIVFDNTELVCMSEKQIFGIEKKHSKFKEGYTPFKINN